MRIRNFRFVEPSDFSSGLGRWMCWAMLIALALCAQGAVWAAGPQGTLTADVNPCTPNPLVGGCFPTLTWTTSGIPVNNLPKVQVRYMGTSGPEVAATGNANVAGDSWTLTGPYKVTTSQPRTFRLYATYDDSLNPSSEILLDEITLKTDAPQARLWATPNPCSVDCDYDELGQLVGCSTTPPSCTPLLQWESSGLLQPKVVLRKQGGANNILCADANVSGSHQLAGITIGASPKTFELLAAGSCGGILDPTPIATVTVTSHAEGTLSCSVDGQPMVTRTPEFLGVIDNTLHGNSSNELAEVAGWLGSAQTRYIRRTVKWALVQQREDGPFDFDGTIYNGPECASNHPSYDPDTCFAPSSNYDTFFGEMVDDGVEPWITLHTTAHWATDVTTGVIRSYCTASNCTENPPLDLDDWRTYVRETVLHLHQNFGAENFEVWQEPDSLGNFNGTSAQYVDLLNAAYDEIKAIDPAIQVWANNGVFSVRPARARKFEDQMSAVLANGLFDGVAVHTFFVDMERNYRAIRWMRDRLDAPASPHQGVPLAITSISNPLDDCQTESFQAAYVLDFYVCAANAGADAAMWFQATEHWPCAPGEKTGLLETAPAPDYHLPKLSYGSLVRLGQEVNQP